MLVKKKNLQRPNSAKNIMFLEYLVPIKRSTYLVPIATFRQILIFKQKTAWRFASFVSNP